MSKKNLKLSIEANEEGVVEIKLTEEEKAKIPRVGETVYLIQEYDIVDESMVGNPVDDEDEDLGLIKEEDLKEKLPKAYSFKAMMVESTALNEERDAVRINGDYVIPLREDGTMSKKRLMVFANEDKARDKYRTLTTVSLKEATRRTALNASVKSYIESALERLHH